MYKVYIPTRNCMCNGNNTLTALDILQGIAQLHSRTVARSHGCTVAWLHGHMLTRLHSCTLVRSHARTLTRSHSCTLALSQQSVIRLVQQYTFVTRISSNQDACSLLQGKSPLCTQDPAQWSGCRQPHQCLAGCKECCAFFPACRP